MNKELDMVTKYGGPPLEQMYDWALEYLKEDYLRDDITLESALDDIMDSMGVLYFIMAAEEEFFPDVDIDNFAVRMWIDSEPTIGHIITACIKHVKERFELNK
jgi:acyl carrier protein